MTDVYQFGAQPSFAAPANDAPYYVSNAPASASGSWTDTLAGVGWFASLSGTMLSAVGSFYAAQTAKNQAKSQALSAEFAQSMACLLYTSVDVCNMALGLIGNKAKVTAISPVDGSAESTHCARYYPIALRSLLEMHNWSFAQRKVCLLYTSRCV